MQTMETNIAAKIDELEIKIYNKTNFSLYANINKMETRLSDNF